MMAKPSVFSNPRMSLKEAKGRRSGVLSFRDLKLIHAISRSGGNVGIARFDLAVPGVLSERFPRLVGRAENGAIVFRAFHEPSFPALLRFYAVSRMRSKSFALACCMRRAASVSLMAAATLFSAFMLNPSRRYCAGLSSNDRVSSGV